MCESREHIQTRCCLLSRVILNIFARYLSDCCCFLALQWKTSSKLNKNRAKISKYLALHIRPQKIVKLTPVPRVFVREHIFWYSGKAFYSEHDLTALGIFYLERWKSFFIIIELFQADSLTGCHFIPIIVKIHELIKHSADPLTAQLFRFSRLTFRVKTNLRHRLSIVMNTRRQRWHYLKQNKHIAL